MRSSTTGSRVLRCRPRRWRWSGGCCAARPSGRRTAALAPASGASCRRSSRRIERCRAGMARAASLCFAVGSRAMRKRKLFFDEKRMSADVADVLEASALLQVTEFELFRIAWRRWYGRTIADRDLEHYYLPYMFRSQVPPWVRQLARQVIAEAEASRLDPASYGIVPRQLTMDMYNRGLRYCLWIAMILGTLLTGAATVAELSPWYQSCYLPPCY